MKNFRVRQFLCIIIALGMCSLFLVTSCKKDNNENNSKLTEEQIDVCVEGATVISSNVQGFVLNAMSEAISKGFTPGDIPSPESKKNTGNPVFHPQNSDLSWQGPDANGWYYRSYSYVYDYSEKVRYGDTIEYEYEISYSGADGSYSSKTTTKYFKHIDDDVVKYDGYSEWRQKSSGYKDISEVIWRIEFEDWNPLTNAGIYDWYWGVPVNSGGDVVPLFRYEHLEATEKTEELLHIRAIWYDDSGDETWDFEYDTPFSPVMMPEIPDLNSK